jgi:hypothetical protein
MFAVETYQVSHVLRAVRAGSSLPVVVDSPVGKQIVKLRGAAHGTSALVAEIIVAELAETLGLSVPARALVWFDEHLVSDDRNDELAALLVASRGLNLGFQWLEGARDLRAIDVGAIDRGTASVIFWLDWLVMNPDRTVRNPNILISHGLPWLIDHGSALGFHHQWSAVTEDSPRKLIKLETHVLRQRASGLSECDEALTARVSRDALRRALAAVPDDFLRTMRPQDAGAAALARRREAYVSFLWKRLRSPHPG